jgi:serine/threonine protein kinase
MATVHYGRLLGPVGFSRTVAIKRLHPHLAKDPEFVTMFLDEARMVARIRHPNVVPTLDVVAADGELLLVMEYVEGESLQKLIRRTTRKEVRIPPAIVSAVVTSMLHGLHAAHEATNERGDNLGIVHRDVSPSNVIVGVDGVARVLDFGVAKAADRSQETQAGTIKGKFGYMSPEQLINNPLDRRSDIFGAAILLWEALTGRRLFKRDNAGAMVAAVLHEEVQPPSHFNPEVAAWVDAVVLKGLERDREKRYATADEMALALEDALQPATVRKVASWIREVAGKSLSKRAEQIAAIESESASNPRARIQLPPDAASNPGMEPTTGSGPFTDSRVGPVSGSGSFRGPGMGPPSGTGPFQPSGMDMRLQHTPSTGSAMISGVTPMPAWPTPAPTRRSGLAVGVAVGVGVATVVLGVVFMLMFGSSTAPEETKATAAPGPTVELTASSEPPAPKSSIAVEASASASSAVSADASASAAAKVKPPPPRQQRPPPPRKPTVDCSNPFTIDKNGKKRPRPECFR